MNSNFYKTALKSGVVSSVPSPPKPGAIRNDF